MGEPLTGVLERQLAALGELLGDALDPEGRDPGEQAGRAAGDREVGDVAEVAVEPCRDLELGGPRRCRPPALPGPRSAPRMRGR